MLYFAQDTTTKIVTEVHDDSPPTGSPYTGRFDWRSQEQAEVVCSQANGLRDGRHYIVIDSGRFVSPRYDVIVAPVRGDLVSRAFNGDYYPCGRIVKISESLRRIETDTGAVFWRRGQSGAWINKGTWCMVPGHIDRLSPEF